MLSIFIKQDGTAWACGNNAYGQLGNGTTVNNNTPAQIASLSSSTIKMAAGSLHNIFLKDDLQFGPADTMDMVHWEMELICTD